MHVYNFSLQNHKGQSKKVWCALNGPNLDIFPDPQSEVSRGIVSSAHTGQCLLCMLRILKVLQKRIIQLIELVGGGGGGGGECIMEGGRGVKEGGREVGDEKLNCLTPQKLIDIANLLELML